MKSNNARTLAMALALAAVMVAVIVFKPFGRQQTTVPPVVTEQSDTTTAALALQVRDMLRRSGRAMVRVEAKEEGLPIPDSIPYVITVTMNPTNGINVNHAHTSADSVVILIQTDGRTGAMYVARISDPHKSNSFLNDPRNVEIAKKELREDLEIVRDSLR